MHQVINLDIHVYKLQMQVNSWGLIQYKDAILLV